MGNRATSDPKESPSRLDDPVETLAGIGPKRAEQLGKLGILCVRDLLYHFPRDYEDRRVTTRIAEVANDDEVTIEAEVISARAVRLRGRMSLAEALLKDDTGEIKATWFGRGFLARSLTPGTRMLLTGKVGTYKGLALKNPEYELLTGDEEDRLNTGCIVPLYRLTEKVTQRMLRRWVRTALDDAVGALAEPLSAAIRKRYGYPELRQAIQAVHFPEDLEDAQTARERFAYGELLALQLDVLRTRARRYAEERGLEHVVDGAQLRALGAALPFRLTGGQRRAVDDLLRDMGAPRPMARLLQGDVGCGKTAVALHAIAAAVDGGYQVALMAPTEVLAEQHFRTLSEVLEALGLEVALLTGATGVATTAREAIADGRAQVVVGTHALFQEKTVFKNLGLVVIDEQHRFGVEQRARLIAKGASPDLLHMTATPIPRSLAMTLYGAMDITVIDELPSGRLPVKTLRLAPGTETEAYQFAAKQAAAGFQSYVICALVEDSDKRALRSAISHFEALSEGPLAALRSALLHGRLDPEEKRNILEDFRRGALDVVCSTTVVEVGVDAPRATTMIIEDAGHFGLTQLHQLRGRVGRGSKQSYCFLLGDAETDEAKARLEILCSTNDGFKIAEEDLKLRGPGETYGARQAGLSDLKAADLVRDVRLIDRARRDAEALLRNSAGGAEETPRDLAL